MAADRPLGNAREEAERLVAAALAAAQFAARRARRPSASDRRDERRDDRRDERRDERRPDSIVDDIAALAGIAGRFLGRETRAQDTGYSRGYDSRRRDAYDDIDDRRRPAGHQFANGSDACCSCPVCRVIDMVRDPSPEFVQRVASGASDLASGVTSVLRAFGGTMRGRPAAPDVVDLDEPAGDDVGARDARADLRGAVEEEPAEEPAVPFAGGADFASIWQEATRDAETKRPPRPSGPPSTPKPMAKKTVKKAVKPGVHRPDPAMAEPARPAPAVPAAPPSADAVRKAVKKAVKKAAPAVPETPAEAAPTAPAAEKAAPAAEKAAPAKKAPAKKAPAKKAAAKKSAGGTVLAKKAADGQTAKAAPKTAKKTAKKAT